MDDDSDLFVVPVEAVGDLPRHGIPVIACGSPELLRTAFLAGCADYLREPWLPEELSVRARAVVDRAMKRRAFLWGEMQMQGNELDLPNGRVLLTRNESLILKALLRVRGRPVPRESLDALLGGHRGRAGSRTIDVQIAAIRRKVRAAAPGAGRFIVCARGEGYLIP
jgi:DNA-binding response OmpR family regulator